jgi:hypothetical protein
VEDLKAQGIVTSWAAGVASIRAPYLETIIGAETCRIRLRKAYGATRLHRGMQRPFRLLPRPRDFGATGRLGRATSQRVVATFHLSPFTFHFSLALVP